MNRIEDFDIVCTTPDVNYTTTVLASGAYPAVNDRDGNTAKHRAAINGDDWTGGCPD